MTDVRRTPGPVRLAWPACVALVAASAVASPAHGQGSALPLAASTQSESSGTAPTTTQPGQAPLRLTPAQRVRLADEMGIAALRAYDEDKLQDATKYANDALQLRDDQPDAMVTAALLMIRAGQAREALPMLQKYVQTDRGTNDWRGFEAVGDILMRSNSPHTAANYYRRALQKTPTQQVGRRIVKPEIQLKLAEALGAMGQGREALELIDSARSSLAQNADLQYRLARILLKSNREEDGLRALDNATQALRREIEDLVRHEELDANELNTKLTLNEEIDRARIRHLEDRFAKAKPAETDAIRISAARAYATSGETDRLLKLARAMATIQLGIRANPKNADMYVELAEYQAAFGARPAAVASLRKALQIDTSHMRAREQLARLGAPATTQEAARQR